MNTTFSTTLKTILKPASFVYGAGAFLRLKAYGTQMLKQTRVNVPVISIGNLTVGGTGKTPLTIDITRQFVSAGYKPAVLSRGYKRQSKDEYVVVSDGEKMLAKCLDAGDEPFLIAMKTPGATVIVGSKRTRTAEIAISQFGCDVLILDDGFQHIAIRRDLDMVLLDYNEDIRQASLLPAGRLREPVAALGRASSVLITKVPPKPDLDRLETLGAIVHQYSPKASLGLISFSANQISSLTETEDGEFPHFQTQRIDSIKGLKVYAFCGLARPNAFYSSLKDSGLNIVGKKSFPDHHWYKEKDLAKIIADADKANAEILLTTEKDLVKLHDYPNLLTKPTYAIDLVTNWIGPKPVYLSTLLTQK